MLDDVHGAPTGRPKDSYCDRIIAPAETVARLQPHFPALGNTRVGRQTGLDRIGIPCFAAFRPNALTLSNSQGKGITDDAARASAVMEAAEFAIAERVPNLCWSGTAKAAGSVVLDLTRLMPLGTPFVTDRELAFCEGVDVVTGRSRLVAVDAVCLDVSRASLSRIAVSTNGLASGNSAAEALHHALCELIERDALTLAGLPGGHSRKIDPQSLRDTTLLALMQRIERAGFEAWLFEQTSDIAVPCFKCVIGDPALGYRRYFDFAVGFGCHPVAARAAIRAVTEAAQTRVTNIAGSRDDYLPDEHRRSGDPSRRARLGEPFAGETWAGPGMEPGSSLADLIAGILRQLERRGVTQIVAVDLSAELYGIAVLKVFAPELEDRSCNANWRPGPRALTALLEAA